MFGAQFGPVAVTLGSASLLNAREQNNDWQVKDEGKEMRR